MAPVVKRWPLLRGLNKSQGAQSIQPRFRPVRPGKLVHLNRWTSFFETFPVRSSRSIEFWTEISGNFGWIDRAQGMDYLSAAQSGLCRGVVVVERGRLWIFFFFLKDYAHFIFCWHRSVCGLPRRRSHRVLTLWTSLQILSQIMKNSLRYRFLFQSKVSIVHVIIKKQLYHAEKELLFYVRGSLV